MIDFQKRPDDSTRDAYRAQLCTEGSPVHVSEIGRTLLGRPIDMYSVGNGRRSFLYVGAHHGTEWLYSSLLYRFLFAVAEAAVTEQTRCGVRIPLLLSTCTLHVVPMLNADGCRLVMTDAPTPPLAERQVRMSGGAGFLRWKANARGVDLNHNYAHAHAEYKRIETRLGIEAGGALYSGEYPESEPECAALSGVLRAIGPSAVLSLHAGEGAVRFSPRESAAVRRCAERIAHLCAYTVAEAGDASDYGGLCDYAGEGLSLPSFALLAGDGQDPPTEESLTCLYDRISAVLFRLPTLL